MSALLAAAQAPASLPVLIQVAPTERGGVFDYLQCLHDQWADAGAPSHVLPLSKALAAERSLDERVGDCCRRSGQAGPNAPCTVVLHFSGYGYAQRGLCFWLLQELRALRQRRQASLHLVVVFHELFATGPPWRSAFWVSGAQSWIAAQLARMADVVWTNTARHAHWLRGFASAATPQQVRPVFSNVGEPLHVPPAAERLPQAVVFGSAPTRQRALAALERLMPALQTLGIEELVEVGSGKSAFPSPAGLPCRRAGRLTAEHLGALLMRSRFGLLDYEGYGLAKSGVFAAYAAHGCVVLNTHPSSANGDGLHAGEHFLALPRLPDDPATPAACHALSSAVHRWYQGHRLGEQAQTLLALARGA